MDFIPGRIWINLDTLRLRDAINKRERTAINIHIFNMKEILKAYELGLYNSTQSSKSPSSSVMLTILDDMISLMTTVWAQSREAANISNVQTNQAFIIFSNSNECRIHLPITINSQNLKQTCRCPFAQQFHSSFKLQS